MKIKRFSAFSKKNLANGIRAPKRFPENAKGSAVPFTADPFKTPKNAQFTSGSIGKAPYSVRRASFTKKQEAAASSSRMPAKPNALRGSSPSAVL